MRDHFKSFFLAGLVSASFATASLAAPMTADEIKSDLIGQPLTGKRLGVTMNLFLNQDGSATLRSTLVDDTGTWRVNGDQLCLKWTEFRGGKEQCSTFTRKNGGFRMKGGPLLKTGG